MPLSDLLTPAAILPTLRANNKKQALHDIAERAAEISGLDAREIFDALMQRERLGSTAVGGAIAIPHGKLVRCDHIFGVFARLEKPIDFEALDEAPVDLIFALVAPEGAGADHLNALSRIARLLRDGKVIGLLRGARDGAALYSILTRSLSASAA